MRSKSDLKSLSNHDIEVILRIAEELGFRGFNGRCAAAAMAINRVLFQNKGVYVIAVNEYLWTHHKHFAGHVLVRFNDVLWDADGRPKTMNDIDDWGDLKVDIGFYKGKFKEYGARWSEKRSSETGIFELESENEIPWGHDEVDEDTMRIALEQFRRQTSDQVPIID